MFRKTHFVLYCVALISGIFIASAIAQPQKKGDFTVNETVTMNGRQLRAGRYNVIWSGAGENVSVTVKKGRKVVATAPARLVTVVPPAHNTVLENKNDSGARSISEIQFRDENYALRIESDKTETAEQK